MLLLWLACGRPDPAPPAPAACADPARRAVEAFDSTVVATTEPAPEHRFLGGGLAIADLDGDGVLDLVLPGPATLTLLLGNGDGTFRPAPFDAVPARDYADAVGASAADYDGDGALDLFVSRYPSENVLLHNRGDGAFDDVTKASGLALSFHSHSAAWGDYDRDGWLDLVVAGRGEPRLEGDLAVVDTPGDPTRLYRNRGDGTFEDRTADLPAAATDGYTFVASFVDLDADGRLDLYFANDYPGWQTGLVVWNRALGWVADDGSAGLNAAVAGMGLGLGDATGDGRDDVLLPAWDRLHWLESTPNGWVDATAARGLSPLPTPDEAWVGWGAELADLDNDTFLDAWVAFGHLDTLADTTPQGGDATNAETERDLVWAGGPAGFEDVTDAWGIDDPGVGRGLAVADLDGNGWPDVVTRDLDGPVRVHLGRCGTAGWTQVALDDAGPNRFGIGAVVRLWTAAGIQQRTVRAGGTGLLSSGPPVVHFGLGSAGAVDRLEVTWPDGETMAVEGPFEPRQEVVLSR